MKTRNYRRQWPLGLSELGLDGLFSYEGQKGLTYKDAQGKVGHGSKSITVTLRRVFGVVAIEPLPDCTPTMGGLFYNTYCELPADPSDAVPDLILARYSPSLLRFDISRDAFVWREHGLKLTFSGPVTLNGHRHQKGAKCYLGLSDHTTLLNDVHMGTDMNLIAA